MDEVTLQKLAAAIYEMLPHDKAAALIVLGYVRWLIESNWGRLADVIPLELGPRPARKPVEKVNHSAG